MQTIGQVLTRWTQRIESQGIDAPRLSVEVITAWFFGIDRLKLLLSREQTLASSEVDNLESWLGRREKGEPLAYIIGHKEFYGQGFYVSDQVLIPRPETELLIETVKELFAPQERFRFADIGTGSGIIGVVLAGLFAESRGVLFDISIPALGVARQNVSRYQLGNRLALVCSDLASAISPDSLELLVANLPYIPEQDVKTVSLEIKNFEPQLALAAGHSGLDAMAPLFKQGAKVLKEGGWLVLEFGSGQLLSLLEHITASTPPWDQVRTYQDFSGQDRVLALKKTVGQSTHRCGQKKTHTAG